jgi:hypothetical protein
VNPAPSGVRSETSVNCTEELLGVVEEYMTSSFHGKLLIPPVRDPTDAEQSVKVTFPKFANCEVTLFTDGLSTIHSADNWLDA